MGKFLKPLLVGELAPEESSQDRGKNVSQTGPREGGKGLPGERVPALRRRVPRELLPVTWGQGGLRTAAVRPPSCCQPGLAPPT